MTLDQLETLVQVARTRGFSRAAVALGLAQPTLSGRIAALEAELGTPLFTRHGHTVEPTEAGRVLLASAERMLALRAEAGEQVRRVRQGGLGRLALGVNPGCSQWLAPLLIEEYWGWHPGAPLHVRVAQTPLLMEHLLDGTVQLALGSLPQMHPRAETLWTYADELALLAGLAHPLARRGRVRRADLVGQTFYSTLVGPTHAALLRLVPDPGHQLLLEATGGEVMKWLVARGGGLTVLPRLTVRDELAAGTLIALELEDTRLPPYEVALARWPGAAITPAARAFTEVVRAARLPALLRPR
jgi:LysR family hydrogen peroxide-inducible transcriptional activator